MDYNQYKMSGMEKLRYGSMGAAGCFVLLYLFYQNGMVGLIGSLAGGVFFCLYERQQLAKKRKWQFMIEFKDAMDAFVSALVAGYSFENAISETYHDLLMLYGKETIMTEELKDIRQKLSLQRPLDELWLELGRRSGTEDVITFAQIYTTARKSGGNLIQVMRRTAANIGEKMEIQREIQTMIAGKKMEATLMMVIPLLILVYMKVFSPGFLDPLYQGILGRLIMTGALLLYVFAVWWSRKIMSCEG